MPDSGANINISGELSASLMGALREFEAQLDRIRAKASNINLGGSTPGGGAFAGGGKSGGASPQAVMSVQPNASVDGRTVSMAAQAKYSWDFQQSYGRVNRGSNWEHTFSDRTVQIGGPFSNLSSAPGGGGGTGSGPAWPAPFDNLHQAASQWLHDTPSGQYAFRFGRGMMLASGMALAEYGTAQIHDTLTGRPDRMANAAISGKLVGGTIGAAIGSIWPGFGSVIGAGVGSEAGGLLSQMMVAPSVAATDAFTKALPYTSLKSGMYPMSGTFPGNKKFGDPTSPGIIPMGSFTTPDVSLSGSAYWARRLAQWGDTQSNRITRDYFGGNEQLGPTWQEMGEGYGIAAQGYMAGGVNPFQNVGMSPNGVSRATATSSTIYSNGHTHPYSNEWVNQKPDGTLIGTLIETVGRTIAGRPQSLRKSGIIDTYQIDKQEPIEPEDLAQRLARRMAERYGKSANEMSRTITPIYGSLPETGSNMADILMKYGAERTQRYYDSTVEMAEKSPTNLDQLLAVNKSVRDSARRAKLGGLSIRNSGMLQELGYTFEMGSLSLLPGGMDSESYTQARKGLQSATVQHFQEQDLMGFNMESMRLSNVSERLNSLPFAPGSRYAVSLATIGMNRRRIQELNHREKQMRASGLLSEELEYNFESQKESLITQNYQAAGTISEGVENRIAAMSAGTPAAFRKFDSWTLASMQLNLVGSPMRRYGALSGRQQQYQDTWVGAMSGGVVGEPRPSNAMDSAGGRQFWSTVVDLLGEIAKSLRNSQDGRIWSSNPLGGQGQPQGKN